MSNVTLAEVRKEARQLMDYRLWLVDNGLSTPEALDAIDVLQDINYTEYQRIIARQEAHA